MFTVSEMERLTACLKRLVPHLDIHNTALTGGVAVELHLDAARRSGNRQVLADVDLVVREMEALASSTTRDFLVSHYHTPQPGVPKAFIQLIDPVTRLRVDIFPDLGDAIQHATSTRVGRLRLPVLDAQRVLEHKLQTIDKASASGPVDAKHWRDAVVLAELCSLERPPLPQYTAVAVLCTDVHLACVRCQLSRSAGFPLAPKHAIFAMLGYV